MADRWSVRVTKDYLVFSAGHFITFSSNRCERIHGHNYRVEIDVRGTLDENSYVVDFIALLEWAKEIVGRLDHRMLLPGKSELISVLAEGSEVTARFQAKRWVFPAEDCIV